MKQQSLFPALNLAIGLVLLLSSTQLSAQEDDGIYGDIYELPDYTMEQEDSVSPLEGYSTVDEYYPEGGYDGGRNESYQEVDENGNTYIINNYYDDTDYSYAARINRFHRPVGRYGYYDSYYTNMYWYTYDPYYYGSSIYVGYWPSYSWWGYNWGWGFGYGWGWNSPYYYPACYGGYYGYGWNGYYGNSYWHGYNHGYHDGLAYGGYYNTYDNNSGIYYGHRGSTASGGTGYRPNTLAVNYNKAAAEGKVNHANKGNYLELASAKPVVVNKPTRANATNLSKPGSGATKPNQNNEVSRTQNTSRPNFNSNTTDRVTSREQTEELNRYQRPATEREVQVQRRPQQNTLDRSRTRVVVPSESRTRSGYSANIYDRNDANSRYSNRQSNTRQNVQRPQPNSNRYTQPSRSTVPSRNYQNTRPSNRSNNYTAPSRNYNQPSRNATPSRGTSPSKSVSPNRGSSSTPSTPSRSSSPSFKSNTGGKSGSGGSSGSRSRGGGRNQ